MGLVRAATNSEKDSGNNRCSTYRPVRRVARLPDNRCELDPVRYRSTPGMMNKPSTTRSNWSARWISSMKT